MSNPHNPEEDIVEAALELPPEERAAYLDQSCGGDLRLRQLVEGLLLAHKQFEVSGEALRRTHRERTEASFPLTEKPGDLIGCYKLLEQIGEGGFGVVYMAEQQQPLRRRVALKITKLGMDTKQVVARFEAERQALALMDHPNIARVMDAGATATGRPYFVMELVRGIRITEYCDQNQLPTAQRLKLFMHVCQAIQHAHQKGVIHRDIKPSNILVTLHDGVPVPKVIDFGIAKATQIKLTEKTIFTQFHQFLGTPAYVSPEQASMSGLDIDTRSDIYSLGVLLYELLTGQTPFDTQELLKAGLEGMRQIIRERQPPRPSTRLRQTSAVVNSVAPPPVTRHPSLSTDLDWIVMKCLEKDRARRYETANGLARDIERHLNDEPIVARPPSRFYELQKAARRHKVGFTATAAVITALLAGILVSTSQAIHARRAQAAEARQRQTADRERQKAVAAEIEAQRSAYAADMLLGFQALEMDHLGRLRELVRKYAKDLGSPGRFDLRGWEWRYLWGQSQDSELFTSASASVSAGGGRVWGQSLGSEVFALRGHSNQVWAAFLLNDGRTIVSLSADRTMKYWDMQSRSVLASIEYPDELCCGALSPNGRSLAVGGHYGTWSLWDPTARRLLLARTNSSAVQGVTFSSDGTKVAVVDDENVEIWDCPSHQQERMIPRKHQVGDGYLHGVAFSPDDRSIAYARGDSRIFLLDLVSGAATEVGPSGSGDTLSLAFRADGRVLVSSDRQQIIVWDIVAHHPPTCLTNHHEQVARVLFSPDGTLLASASGDQTVKLWDAHTWQEIATFRGHEAEVRDVSFSSDGKRLISSGQDETVRVWDLLHFSPNRERIPFPGWNTYLPSRPSADRWLNYRAESQIWSSISFIDLLTLTESSPRAVPMVFRTAKAIGISSDAGVAALGLREGAVELWATEPLQKLATVAMSRLEPRYLALSKNRGMLAVARSDQTTELWDLNSNRLIRTFPPLEEPVADHWYYAALSFWSGDRRFVRATAPSNRSGALLEIFLIPENETRVIRHMHKADLNNFCLSDDGKLLATSGWDDQIELWDVEKGLVFKSLRGQLICFSALAFSPDNSRLAAGGGDGTITLWDTTTWQQVANWKAHRRLVDWVCFIEGGQTIITLGEPMLQDAPRELRIWRAPLNRGG